MKELRTEVLITAPPSVVWNILTDFQSYPDWNPFITKLEGDFRPGSRISVLINPPNSKPMGFKPVCKVWEEERELRWLGNLLIPGIFDGEHIFELEAQPNGSTLFIQREIFRGLVVPLIWNSIHLNTKAGFEAMNDALKMLAEKQT